MHPHTRFPHRSRRTTLATKSRDFDEAALPAQCGDVQRLACGLRALMAENDRLRRPGTVTRSSHLTSMDCTRRCDGGGPAPET